MPMFSCTDSDRMDHASGSEKPTSGRNPIAPRTTLVVFGVLFGVERLITLRWSVPLWSGFAFVLLLIALAIQRLLARSQPKSSALRPLTLISVAVTVVFTVLVALSDTPTDRWVLLVWLVPVAIATADILGQRLPAETLAYLVACLLAAIITAQLALIWQTHGQQARMNTFDDRLAQICADTASLSSRPTTDWIVANDSMLRQLQTLTPPDGRTRTLTGYLIAELQGAEASFNYNDPAKQRAWQESARYTVRDLGINGSCGVF